MYLAGFAPDFVQLSFRQLLVLMKELGVEQRANTENMLALTKAVEIGRLTEAEWEFFASELNSDKLTHAGLAIFGKAFTKGMLTPEEKTALAALFNRSDEAAA